MSCPRHRMRWTTGGILDTEVEEEDPEDAAGRREAAWTAAMAESQRRRLLTGLRRTKS